MRSYYLKLGTGNRLAARWLSGDNPLRRPAAVIFFGRVTVDQLLRDEAGAALSDLKAEQKMQALNFIESTKPALRQKTVMVVVADGYVWLLRPDGAIAEHDPRPGERPDDSRWKMMPVKVLEQARLSDVPPVLAGINSDTFLVRGTFREITHWGNIKAIYATLGWALPPEHLAPAELTAARLLECLSSIELETLVAKLFEAAGCFVPAYRGGTMRDADLFAHNDGNELVALGDLVVEPGERTAIQVKSRTRLKARPAAVDFLIALDAPKQPQCRDANWLFGQTRRSPSVWSWLQRSLSWLPAEFLAAYGLASEKT